VGIFAGYSGKACAQAHDPSSTGFADYAMKLGEDRPLELGDTTSALSSAKTRPEMIGGLNGHLEVWANYYQHGHFRATAYKVKHWAQHHLRRHAGSRLQSRRY